MIEQRPVITPEYVTQGMLGAIWPEAESDLVRARWWQLAGYLNWMAQRWPVFHPSIIFALARLEGGRSERGTRFNNLFGITGEYGPQLSGRGAEISGINIRVPHDMFHVRQQGNFRSYPHVFHATVDAVRLLTDSRVYAGVNWQGSADTIVRGIAAEGWNSSADYPDAVLAQYRRIGGRL